MGIVAAIMARDVPFKHSQPANSTLDFQNRCHWTCIPELLCFHFDVHLLDHSATGSFRQMCAIQIR